MTAAADADDEAGGDVAFPGVLAGPVAALLLRGACPGDCLVDRLAVLEAVGAGEPMAAADPPGRPAE